MIEAPRRTAEMATLFRNRPAVRATVIMACFDGAAHLAEALEAVVGQCWDGAWEFVFADNGSTDGSWDIFEAFRARHPDVPMLGVDASQRRGKSHALNMAVAAARGPAIIVVDADDVPAQGWLRAMAEALETHDFVSAGNELERLNGGPTGQYRGVPQDGVWRLHHAPFAPCTAGATMGFTRRLFDQVGGFDPDFQPEDVEFCIRAHLNGFALHRTPGARVHYRLRSDHGSIFRQALAYNRCEIKTAQRYSESGEAQHGPWIGLARAAAVAVSHYLAWRLVPARRTPSHGAVAHWHLGVVAGQIAGILDHRAPPTVGRPPKVAQPPEHKVIVSETRGRGARILPRQTGRFQTGARPERARSAIRDVKP